MNVSSPVMQGVPVGEGTATEVESSAEVCECDCLGSLVGLVLADKPVDLLGHELAHRRRPSGGEHPGLGDGFLVKLDGQVPLHRLNLRETRAPRDLRGPDAPSTAKAVLFEAGRMLLR